MLPITVVPSLPAASLREIKHLCKSLKGIAREVQIDIVDGVYVPHTSWPFTERKGMGVFSKMQKYTQDFMLEVDCMVQKPEQYLDTIAALNPKRVCIHVGSTDAYRVIIEHAYTHGYHLGFAFTNDTPLDVLDEYFDDVSYVQLMGIKEVGQQGQPFDERTLTRACALRTRFPELEIAVDGSVNATTMPRLYAAGVNRFAPGSAIAKQNDPAIAYKQLLSLVT
tara:strand:+ start:2263 stop:2931 length:669 start_codon:yes stop_codon:yes gene_type:complete